MGCAGDCCVISPPWVLYIVGPSSVSRHTRWLAARKISRDVKMLDLGLWIALFTCDISYFAVFTQLHTDRVQEKCSGTKR